ncbi:hypothetical protein N9795_01415 [Candidatus Pelagibacter sp.]|nr:hypothetical protein [Candidatus Pelagibacter sp.]
MNETSNSWLGTTGTAINTGYSGNINGYSGTSVTTVTDGSGLTLSGNSTINYSNNLGSLAALTPTNHMTPKQVNVAVFTIKRDKDTNEINSTEFVKELWIEQKNGTSIDLLVAKQLGNDFDPETTIIKVLATLSF